MKKLFFEVTELAAIPIWGGVWSARSQVPPNRLKMPFTGVLFF